MRRTELLIVGIVVFALSSALTVPVAAHDLEPPGWRDLTHPYATFTEWQFSTPLNPAPPEHALPVGDGITPSGSSSPIATMMPGMVYDPGHGGGWFPLGPLGGSIRLEICNWIDHEPIKYIRVQISYLGDPLAQPEIINIFGDDHATGPALAYPTGPAQWYAIDPWDTEWHWWQDWEMIPNPDWEVIEIFVPRDTFIHQIVVDTVSIPEPASLFLLGISGVFMLIRRAGR